MLTLTLAFSTFLDFLYSNLCYLLFVVCCLSLPFYTFSTSRYSNHYIPEIKVSTSRDKLRPKAWDVCSKAWDVCFEPWDILLYEERKTFISGERFLSLGRMKNKCIYFVLLSACCIFSQCDALLDYRSPALILRQVVKIHFVLTLISAMHCLTIARLH